MNMRAEPEALLDPLARVAERTSHAVIITDAANRISWANQAFVDFAGCTLAACMGRRPGAVLPFLRHDVEARTPLLAAVAGHQPARVRTRIQRCSGSRHWVDIDLQPLFSQAGPSRAASPSSAMSPNWWPSTNRRRACCIRCRWAW